MAITITVTAPPRGSGTQASTTFQAQSMEGSFGWGVQPGSATITYVGTDTGGLSVGAMVRIALGNKLFFGICKADVFNTESSTGQLRTLQFVDFRDFLKWDYTFCAFNKSDIRLVNGVRVKRYKHMYPGDYATWTWTYTNTPLMAYQILAAVLGGPTIGSPWKYDLTSNGEYPTGVLNMPVYDFDCLDGKRLDAALSEIAQRTGTVFTQMGTDDMPYRLVWTRKGGANTTVSFPATSDVNRLGIALSENATNVCVLGGRNQYQVLDMDMVPDWVSAWEQFLVFEVFADHIYNIGTDPLTGVAYVATPNDPEQYIGRQLALARAMEITVREYVALRNSLSPNAGNVFADTRKFCGRSRMDMPAALYLQTLVYRAFKPSATGLTNVNGQVVPMTSLDIVDQLLCRVSHDPKTASMTAYPLEPVDGNGYAIAKGYMVGADLFKTLKPDQFTVDFFSDTKRAWAAATFQIDDSGEGVRFIVFDAPVIVSNNLLVDVDGNKVMNAAFTLTVPSVKAALVFEAERFQWWQGTSPNVSRDHVENVPPLNQEIVLKPGTPPVYSEVTYADGKTAAQKATEVANYVLLRQYSYTEGGFLNKWDGVSDLATFGSQLSSMVDRVNPRVHPDAVTEQVDLTNERQRDNFEPEREFERRTVQNSLYPGQQQLRWQAEAARKIAFSLRQSPFIANLLSKLLSGQLGGTEPLKLVWCKSPPAGTLAVGTPIRKTPVVSSQGAASTNTQCTVPSAVTSSDSVFAGVTVRANENQQKPFYVQQTGETFARVMGPVAVNDPIGLATPGTDNTYLVKGGTPSVGMALQKIDNDANGNPVVKLIKVMLGSGGGSAGAAVSMFFIKTLNGGDWFIANKVENIGFRNGVLTGYPGEEVRIAKPEPQRKSIASENIDGVTISYSAPPSLPTPPDGYVDNNRVASDGTGNESQVCFPRYISMTGLGVASGSAVALTSQCVCFATKPDNGTGVNDDAGKAVPWLEISPARVWAKRFN